MKIVHWAYKNGSGLAHVAMEMCQIERQVLKYDSQLIDTNKRNEWAEGMDADIHVIHSALPDMLLGKKDIKTVFIAHGTPEHCFETGIHDYVEGKNAGFVCDAFTLSGHWARQADVFITFWPRHKRIWDTLMPKGKETKCIQMPIDTIYWSPGNKSNCIAGSPAIFTAENSHNIKWPLDLTLSWARINNQVPDGRLVLGHLPLNQVRMWSSLANQANVAHKMFLMSVTYDKEGLRHMLRSCDYYCNLVRYGDYNRICLEAKACGAKVIAYAGNPYADYHITEGSNEDMDRELVSIFNGAADDTGDCRNLNPVAIHGVQQYAEEMRGIYEAL